MKTLILKRNNNFKPKNYVYRTALDSDYSTLINEDVTIIDEETGKLIIVYFVIPKVPKELLKSLLRIKYDKNKRLKGLITHSRIFGWKPREQIRNDMCTSTSLSTKNPIEHGHIVEFGKILTKYYKKLCPAVYKEHKKIATEKILPEWQIEGLDKDNKLLEVSLGNFDENDITRYEDDYHRS